MKIPTEKEFIEGIEAFHRNEARQSAYDVSMYYLEKHWGDPEEMAKAIEVLLLSWNKMFYKYHSFDINKLKETLHENMDIINNFRKRDISTFKDEDKEKIKILFHDLLESLKIKRDQKRPMVSVVKALHMLAPNFFPLLDQEIAKNYEIDYHENPEESYLKFMEITKEMIERIRNYKIPEKYRNETLLKLIDEYNYSKFTKRWI